MSGNCGLNVPEVTDQSQGEQGEDYQSGSNVTCLAQFLDWQQ